MPRLEEFVANLAKSQLVDPGDLDRLHQRLGIGSEQGEDAAVRLARRLIEEGLLTSYQARKVLAGNTKGFFLGGYRILRRLGEGGMGKVYLAVHEHDGHRVAIKVLPPRRIAEQENALKRFQREMELSSRVRHPNVARTLDFGVQESIHYMIMEYVPGDSLYHLIKSEHGGSGPLRVPDAARYFLKVLDGLAAAHHVGLVHRDIKPSNLMITPQGDAKILDLGLARAMGEDSPLTHPNAVVGTLDYASPEQLSNAAKADHRSDLYSVGCTLYFTLAGQPPFEGGDIVNKIFKQRMDDPEPLEQVARGVPSAFAAIVRKLMAKNPEERYQSCRELQNDLARWTDPRLVRAILGSEAESARAFRPPPPDLNDEDLRLHPEAGGPISTLSLLRELGDPEPAPAPMHKPPAPPRPALLIPETDAAPPPRPGGRTRSRADSADLRWVVRFSISAFLLGTIAVLLITLLRTWR